MDLSILCTYIGTVPSVLNINSCGVVINSQKLFDINSCGEHFELNYFFDGTTYRAAISIMTKIWGTSSMPAYGRYRRIYRTLREAVIGEMEYLERRCTNEVIESKSVIFKTVNKWLEENSNI